MASPTNNVLFPLLKYPTFCAVFFFCLLEAHALHRDRPIRGLNGSQIMFEYELSRFFEGGLLCAPDLPNNISCLPRLPTAKSDTFECTDRLLVAQHLSGAGSWRMFANANCRYHSRASVCFPPPPPFYAGLINTILFTAVALPPP